MTGLFLAQQATNAAANGAGSDWSLLVWGVALFLLAIVAFVVELMIPSGGLLGLLCAAGIIGSLVAFFKYDTTLGIVALLTYLFLWPLLLVFVFKLWLHSPLAKRMILGAKDQSPVVAPDEAAEQSERARRERMVAMKQLIGARGVAVTALRPVGTIRIADQRIDAMSETGIIEADVPVVITDIYDNQVKVRPASGQ